MYLVCTQFALCGLVLVGITTSFGSPPELLFEVEAEPEFSLVSAVSSSSPVLLPSTDPLFLLNVAAGLPAAALAFAAGFLPPFFFVSRADTSSTSKFSSYIIIRNFRERGQGLFLCCSPSLGSFFLAAGSCGTSVSMQIHQEKTLLALSLRIMLTYIN
ncbi:uncharacterized protein LOC132254616 [Vitis vinifera]|uniref:uncharacterized protein LOC132254616 n=1 Tax=Vitis vinifera TaxID=29760 RepID=UPI00288323CD|nr:uncharacterized protein LOC132254616 [Vitis vinifera]